jgi:hypothetical protein
MSSPEDETPAGDHTTERWDALLRLNRHLVAGSVVPPAEGDERLHLEWTPDLLGAPPAVPAVSAEIEHARDQFHAFTEEARALEARVDRGEGVISGEIGAALDKARGWVEYLGPAGPLRRGFPPSTDAQVYVDALARIGEVQRVAEQWVGYLAPLWERISAAPQAQARAEAECLQRVATAEKTFSERRFAFTLSSGSMAPQQIEERIREMNDLLASVRTLAAGASGACYERANFLAGKIEKSLREEFEFTLGSRRSWYTFQVQQGRIGPGGGPGSGRPGPGSPEWFQGAMGMNCYWCGSSLAGLPAPVYLCPRCGRFPQPHA